MGLAKPIWGDPGSFVRSTQPDRPVVLFSPEHLWASARQFLDGFPGLVTYAVKANPEGLIIENLLGAGLYAFDVASVPEMDQVRSISKTATLHYNNPVRSRAELRAALARSVRSFSVDAHKEVLKIADLTAPDGIELSVRFKLPVAGAAYDFGGKFGATEEQAVDLLRLVRDLGFLPSMTFHPGTQCEDASAWTAYIDAAERIARTAGVELHRLNVGGGFPSNRDGNAPDLGQIFEAIDTATDKAFGPSRPPLLCEPGRAMVAEAFALVTRVRAIPEDGSVFLNDGIYGGLAELAIMGTPQRISVLSSDGTPRTGMPQDRRVFGPTCDSLDELPGPVALPDDLEEEDFLIFHGMGAYSTCTATRFNGFGDISVVTATGL